MNPKITLNPSEYLSWIDNLTWHNIVCPTFGSAPHAPPVDVILDLCAPRAITGGTSKQAGIELFGFSITQCLYYVWCTYELTSGEEHAIYVLVWVGPDGRYEVFNSAEEYIQSKEREMLHADNGFVDLGGI